MLPDTCDLGTRETAPRPKQAPVIAYRDADYTDEVAAATQPVWEKIHNLVTPEDWILKAPLVYRINKLKKERHAIILAHNYQSPEIFLGVADFVGDSLELARKAALLRPEEAPVVVMCGVHFMAETVKVLAPDRTVLIPDVNAGCSLSESISGEDVRRLKAQHPGVPVVVYVNTSAEVKAESDATCTSSNAVHVVEAIAKEFKTDRVLFLPDRFLAMNVAARTKIKIIAWEGECIVHERFTPDEIRSLRQRFPGARVLAHPECPPEVLQEADYVGSTSGMIQDVQTSGAKKVVMITECSMADNVASANPEVDFLRPCVLCPHMQRITLPKILQSLETLQPAVEVAPQLAARAKQAVDKMLTISQGVKPGSWHQITH